MAIKPVFNTRETRDFFLEHEVNVVSLIGHYSDYRNWRLRSNLLSEEILK